MNTQHMLATNLDYVCVSNQAVIHLREQEALEKERLQREQEEAEAAEALRLKRLRDEIYNLETWVVKICPQWEQDELERQRREELEEERLERLQYYIPEQDDTALSAPQSEGTARTVSDGASENIERVESGARSGKELFKLLQTSAKTVQVSLQKRSQQAYSPAHVLWSHSLGRRTPGPGPHGQSCGPADADVHSNPKNIPCHFYAL
jgi:hypothetical protein